MPKHIYLKPNERSELEQLIKSGTRPAQLTARARTLLLLDRSQGSQKTLQEVSEAALVSLSTVHNVKRRYLADGLPGVLNDKPRPGRPPFKMTGDVEAQLIALACSDPPEGYDRWTLRLLADRLVTLELVDSISHVAVGDTLKKTNLSLGE
jgi:transposase